MTATAIRGDFRVVAWLGLGALCALGLIGTIMAGVAADRRHRCMGHRVGIEALGRVGVAVAALDRASRNMRWRCHPGCSDAVVTRRAVGVGWLMNVCAARPACESSGSSRMTGDAILTARWDVAGIRRRTIGPFRSLACVDAVMAGIAAAAADRRVIHRVGREARSRVRMAIAALDRPGRNMGWRTHASCRRSIVASRAIRVGGLVDVGPARPAGEAGCSAGVTSDAVAASSGNVARVRCSTLGALGAFCGVRTAVAGVAAGGAHCRVVHGIDQETWGRVGVAVAALDAGHRNMRRRGQPDCDYPIVAARAVGVGPQVNVDSARPACETRR